MKLSVFIATSLDGFIARNDGSVDWLMAYNSQVNTEDYGFKAFFESVDCMIMGRKTMDLVLTFGQWPYQGKRVIILSNTLKNAPDVVTGKVEIYSGPLTALVEKLSGEGCKRVYVDGGKTIQSFIKESLITDLSITKIPVLLGEGRPLFGKIARDIHLKHIETRTYPAGLVNSTYEIENS